MPRRSALTASTFVAPEQQPPPPPPEAADVAEASPQPAAPAPHEAVQVLERLVVLTRRATVEAIGIEHSSPPPAAPAPVPRPPVLPLPGAAPELPAALPPLPPSSLAPPHSAAAAQPAAPSAASRGLWASFARRPGDAFQAGLQSIGRQMGALLADTLREGVALDDDAVAAAAAAAAADGDATDEASARPATSAWATAAAASASASASAAAAATAAEAPPARRHLALSYRHVLACIDSRHVSHEAAVALFDANGDGVIERNEFVAACEALHGDLGSLRAALAGQQNTSTSAINVLLGVVFWSLVTISVLFIFDLRADVLVPLGTVLVSASFAIGPSLAQAVSSLMFVLVARPYAVGDRVTVSGILVGSHGEPEILLVRRIELLYTAFLRLTNKEIMVPNAHLATCAIENFRRSPPAVFRIELTVSTSTTAMQLEQLRRRLNAYLVREAASWRPTATLRCSGIDRQAVTLTIWLSSSHTWQNLNPLYRAVFSFYIFLLSVLRETKIVFRAPDQKVAVEMTK